MTDWLWTIAGSLAFVTATAMATVYLVKVIRHRRAKQASFRSAIYMAAIGEIVSRSTLPGRDLDEWADDPAFRETFVDFLNFVDGEERSLLVQLAHQLGLVDSLHRGLSSGRKESTRLSAAAGLAEIASPASRQPLRAALQDESPEVRISAAAGLSLIGESDDVSEVLAALEKEDRWAAERMADSLIRFGSAAVQSLSNYVLITGPHLMPIPHHLPIVVRVLGLIGDERASTALLQSLSGEDAFLRIKAAAALAHPWGPDVTTALIRRLADEDWRVRAQAATALAKHGDPSSLPALAKSLGDDAWWVRQNAAASIAVIDNGVDVLFAALEDEDQYAVDAALSQLMEMGYLDEEQMSTERLRLVTQLQRPHLLAGEVG